MEMVHDICSTLFTEFGTALTTILPILFRYCYKYCYSDRGTNLQFYWCRKPEYPEKTIDLRKSLKNFITQCCIEYTSPEWNSNSHH